jgi:hypothetical protein
VALATRDRLGGVRLSHLLEQEAEIAKEKV